MRKLKPILLIVLIFGFFLSSPCTAVDKITSQHILQEIEKIKPEIIKIRRFLHINPELSNREFQTSNLIASKLMALAMDCLLYTSDAADE